MSTIDAADLTYAERQDLNTWASLVTRKPRKRPTARKTGAGSNRGRLARKQAERRRGA